MEIQVPQEYYLKKKYASLERFISYFYQIDCIRETGAKSVLFIGVGDGLVTDLIKKGYEVTTMDIDPALKPDVVGDIRALPFKDASFDLVCAFEVLEHIPLEEDKAALKEIARVSKGDALISIPHRRTGLELVFKFPYIRSLLKREFLRLALLVPVRFPGLAISGQHHWEIDGRTTSLSSFRTLLRQHFAITREITPPLDCYHRFFFLKKQPSA